MASLGDLPSLPPHAAALIAAFLGVVWVALRVGVLRRREARRLPEDPQVPAAAWLRRLAAWRGTDLALGVVGALLGAAIAWTLR